MTTDSFVYEWVNKYTDMRYIGKHTGSIDDGYIASGKYFLENYTTNPKQYYRKILWQGESSAVFGVESYYIKTRLLKYGIEKLYNISSTKSKINYKFLIDKNLLNFVKCMHCDAICIRCDNNEDEVIEFENNHYYNCTQEKNIKIPSTPNRIYSELHNTLLRKCYNDSEISVVNNYFDLIESGDNYDLIPFINELPNR